MISFAQSSLLVALCTAPSYAAFTPPARINVPMFFTRTGLPAMAVGMSQDNVQRFNFTLSTSTGLTAVANKQCSGCTDTPTYDISLSDTAKSLSGTTAGDVALGGGSVSGPLIKENCALFAQDGKTWNYPNQTIITANNQASSPFHDGTSGILGLGVIRQPQNTSGFEATMGDSIYGQYYLRNPEAQNFTFGMALNAPIAIPGSSNNAAIAPGASSLSDAGTLNWLQTDESLYHADQVQWKGVQENVPVGYMANNPQPDWTVALDGWTARVGGSTVSKSGDITTIVEPYYPGIYVPGQQANLIHGIIEGAQQSKFSTIDGETSSWLVPCDTKITFMVQIGSQSFTVDESILVVPRGDGTCSSTIEGFTDSNVGQYILGARFMSQLYVVFQIPRDGQSQIGFASRKVAAKSHDVGAIVGGVVGGVAGVIALGLLGYFLIRRNRDNSLIRRTTEIVEEHKTANTVEPYMLQSAPTPATMSPLLGDPHSAPPSYEESEVSSPTRTNFTRDSVVGNRDSKAGYLGRIIERGSNPNSPMRSDFSGPSNAV